MTVALQRLHQKGLVDYLRYQGAQLTDEGERHALEMVRHHRLIERFLVEFLDYDWNDVHEEAHRLEHVISEEMERRIAAKVSDPTTDPHGDSIPNEALDALQADDARQLTSAPDGTSFVVARVRDRDRAVPGVPAGNPAGSGCAGQRGSTAAVRRSAGSADRRQRGGDKPDRQRQRIHPGRITRTGPTARQRRFP